MINAINIYSDNILFSNIYGGKVLKKNTKPQHKINDKYFSYDSYGKVQNNTIGQNYDKRI